MSDPHPSLEAPATVANGHPPKGGGNLSQQFPNKLALWIDDALRDCIRRDALANHERESVIIRRYLRFAARASGLYQESN